MDTSPDNLKIIKQKLEEVADQHLGHYVYSLADPRDGKVFYVGKGQGARVLSHLNEALDAEQGKREHTSKTRRLAELVYAGEEPRWTIISRNHKSATEAEIVEAAVMMALSESQNGPVLNIQAGQHGAKHGALTIEDLDALTASPVNPSSSHQFVYVFPIGNSVARGESVFNATRRSWKVAEKWRRPAIAVGLDGGLAKGVFNVTSWSEVDDSKHEFIGSELHNEDLLGQRWTQIINAARGYWQRGNWVVVEFDGKGKFRFLRGSSNDEWQDLV